jgi:hypothetical protein
MILRVPPNLLTVGAGAGAGAAGEGFAGVVAEVPQLVKIVTNTNSIARDTVNLFKFLPPYIFMNIEAIFCVTRILSLNFSWYYSTKPIETP